MNEDYLLWLLDLYEKRSGSSGTHRQATLEQAVQIVKSHCRTWIRIDDLVASVATEMAERLRSSPENPSLSFLRMLDLCADTVRHRISREAKKQGGLTSPKIAKALPFSNRSQAAICETIVRELMETFSLEEQVIIDLVLQGKPVDDTARILKVSERTIYRRLENIWNRLNSPD